MAVLGTLGPPPLPALRCRDGEGGRGGLKELAPCCKEGLPKIMSESGCFRSFGSLADWILFTLWGGKNSSGVASQGVGLSFVQTRYFKGVSTSGRGHELRRGRCQTLDSLPIHRPRDTDNNRKMKLRWPRARNRERPWQSQRTSSSVSNSRVCDCSYHVEFHHYPYRFFCYSQCDQAFIELQALAESLPEPRSPSNGDHSNVVEYVAPSACSSTRF